MSCFVCNNAKIDFSLRHESDLSFIPFGFCDEGFRIMIASGDCKPLRILFEDRTVDGWEPVGVYYPQFCPNCGRKIIEYSIPMRGDYFSPKKPTFEMGEEV